jgi:hypothetical protein
MWLWLWDWEVPNPRNADISDNMTRIQRLDKTDPIYFSILRAVYFILLWSKPYFLRSAIGDLKSTTRGVRVIFFLGESFFGLKLSLYPEFQLYMYPRNGLWLWASTWAMPNNSYITFNMYNFICSDTSLRPCALVEINSFSSKYHLQGSQVS